MVWPQSCGKTNHYPNLLTAGEGFIPAHAGKTGRPSPRLTPARAHPHSRREHATTWQATDLTAGYSPLTRGNRIPAQAQRAGHGFIPAHAGKTSSFSWLLRRSAAHPHSRRENGNKTTTAKQPHGSSPLTRGKRDSARDELGCVGLIPAHTGKTHPRNPSFPA